MADILLLGRVGCHGDQIHGGGSDVGYFSSRIPDIADIVICTFRIGPIRYPTYVQMSNSLACIFDNSEFVLLRSIS